MLLDHREVHTGFSGSDLFGGDESLTTLRHPWVERDKAVPYKSFP